MPLDMLPNTTELTRWLIEGRENLIRSGWHPGPGSRGDNGTVCIMAASPVYGRQAEPAARVQAVMLQAIRELGYPDPGHIPYFNDAPGRTFDEVLAVCDRSIEISLR